MFRNDGSKIMQPIKIARISLTRIRKRKQFGQFRWRSSKVIPYKTGPHWTKINTGCGMQVSSSESGSLQRTEILVYFTSIVIAYLMGFISLDSWLLHPSRGLATLDLTAIEFLKQKLWLKLLSATGLMPLKYHTSTPFLPNW